MPEVTDYLRLLAKRKADEDKAETERIKSIIPRIREIAEKAQMVVGHPGWQFYADSLETRISEVEKLRKQTTDSMVFGKAMGHELELLKLQLNTMDAEIRALRYAQELIPQAIEQGQRVSSGVNSRAAGDSTAN